ncbi:MAG: SRPBCC family protein [Deltaproteobacteria bacterium]
MAFYQFKIQQFISVDSKILWDFISAPANLKRITPEYMGFDITSDNLPQRMYQGMIISYMVSPLFGIKTTWVTEITHVADGHYFVDEQRIGPYKLWHHQHILEKKSEGTLMTDIVSYSPPFGPLGMIFNKLVIRKKLKEIFDYRRKAIEDIFRIG